MLDKMIFGPNTCMYIPTVLYIRNSSVFFSRALFHDIFAHFFFVLYAKIASKFLQHFSFGEIFVNLNY